jgi:hypothetical protein
MANTNQTNSTSKAQQAEHDVKQDIQQGNPLTDTPPEFTVNNRGNNNQDKGDNTQGADSNAAPDSTDAGYDETVANDPVGGFEEADMDDLIEADRENTPDGIPTLTPSPTARSDEDPSALEESNIAGEAPTQNV